MFREHADNPNIGMDCVCRVMYDMQQEHFQCLNRTASGMVTGPPDFANVASLVETYRVSGLGTKSYPATVDMLEALPKVLDTEHPIDGQLNTNVIDLCIAGFYWLMRPAEHCGFSTRNDDQSRSARTEAFRLRDIEFYVDGKLYNATAVPLNDVNAVSSANLTFTDQKNAVRGEKTGHRATSHPLLCPVKALFRLVRHLRTNSAPNDSPMCAVYDTVDRPRHMSAEHVTNALRHAATELQEATGIDPHRVSARSLRPGGATALLCADVDQLTIQLLGRWQSDAMLTYLRVQAAARRHNCSQHMLENGRFTCKPRDLAVAGSSAPPHQLPRRAAALL